MAFAIHIITQSTDHYTFAFDGTPNKKEIIDSLKENLGDEFDYIDYYDYDSTYKIKFCL